MSEIRRFEIQRYGRTWIETHIDDTIEIEPIGEEGDCVVIRNEGGRTWECEQAVFYESVRQERIVTVKRYCKFAAMKHVAGFLDRQSRAQRLLKSSKGV